MKIKDNEGSYFVFAYYLFFKYHFKGKIGKQRSKQGPDFV